MDKGGFTQIPHWLMSMLYRSDLTGRELKVILYIIRETYGYHVKSQKIAYGRIAEATGIDRRGVIRVIQSLEAKKWISVRKKAKCVNIIRLLPSGAETTSASGKNHKKLVAQKPPIKNNPKSDPSDSHSLSECDPRVKETSKLEEELGDEYE